MVYNGPLLSPGTLAVFKIYCIMYNTRGREISFLSLCPLAIRAEAVAKKKVNLRMHSREENIHKMNKKYWEYMLVTLLTIGGIFYLMSLFMGFRLTSVNNYNTYSLQADSWRLGRLDMGQDYPWLELAIREGKYYCSFPPFPSYVLFPLTLFFGSSTPDYVLLLLLDLLAAFYLYRLAVKLGVKEETAALLTIFVTVGANTLFVMVSPWVWFLAQLMCFVTAVMAIYYAKMGRGALSLFLWAASVGCRPMQVLFLPVLLLLLYQHEREKDTEVKAMKLVLRRWYWAIPMGLLAISYMLLNYFRFGNILEFGHNYLPEFVRAENGQFHPDYIKTNLPSLFRLPQYNEDGTMLINQFGNLSFFMVCPITVAALLGLGYAIYKKNVHLSIMGILIVVLSDVYLLVVTMHKTLGGWHFGNRYVIDILPYVYLLVGLISAKYPKLAKYCLPLCVFGICLNIVGTVIVYNGLS